MVILNILLCNILLKNLSTKITLQRPSNTRAFCPTGSSTTPSPHSLISDRIRQHVWTSVASSGHCFYPHTALQPISSSGSLCLRPLPFSSCDGWPPSGPTSSPARAPHPCTVPSPSHASIWRVRSTQKGPGATYPHERRSKRSSGCHPQRLVCKTKLRMH